MHSLYFDKARKISSSRLFIKTLFLAEKSAGVRYFRYRLLRPLLKGYYKLFNFFNPGRPWTSPASIIIFEQLLTKDMIGLEYGSGRSTLFFARYLKRLYSIEHFADWYSKVKQMLREKNIINVEYMFIPKNSQLETNDNTDEFHRDFTGSEERPEYADYANKVLDFDDGYFDFILIDGRSRVNCGLNALPKLKQGGIFVLDNSERKRYAPLHEALSDWQKVETTTGLSNTTIWFKP